MTATVTHPQDALIADLRTEVRARQAAQDFPDQTVGGCLMGTAEAAVRSYRAGKTLILDGKELARVEKKAAGRDRSPGTGGRAVERIIAQERIISERRDERIDTPTYKGETEVVYIHIPPEHRRTAADAALYLLPPPPERKRHGGRKTITLPPEVAAAGVPVRRSRQTTEKFHRLDADRSAPPLAVVAHPAVVDHWQADGTAMTAEEAEAFQVEIGVEPPPPPPWRPVRQPFQLDARRTKGTGRQVETAPPAAADPDPFQDETAPTATIHRNQGCRVPSCGSPPARSGYCAAHDPEGWAGYLELRGHAPPAGPPAREQVVV